MALGDYQNGKRCKKFTGHYRGGEKVLCGEMSGAQDHCVECIRFESGHHKAYRMLRKAQEQKAS